MNEMTDTIPSRAPQSAGEPALERAIERATKALSDLQQKDGHWLFELEADATIPAEYVLLQHYLGEGDALGIEPKIAAYLKRTQRAQGGWPLVHDGGFDISASVKAYFALKMIGEDPDAEPMRRARAAILAHGGAARSNVFTRVLLALYGMLGWHAVPVMPVEIMLLPRAFPFHIAKISYWARTVIVPRRCAAPARRRIRLGAGSCCSRRSTRHCAWPSHGSRANPAGARSSGRKISCANGSTARTGWARFFRPWPMR